MTIREPETERAGREERSCVGGMFGEALIQGSEPGTNRREEDPTIESSDWLLRQSGRHDRPTSKEWRWLRPGGSDVWDGIQGLWSTECPRTQ